MVISFDYLKVAYEQGFLYKDNHVSIIILSFFSLNRMTGRSRSYLISFLKIIIFPFLPVNFKINDFFRLELSNRLRWEVNQYLLTLRFARGCRLTKTPWPLASFELEGSPKRLILSLRSR